MKNRNALIADLAFLFLFLLIFLCIVFLASDPDNIWTNSIILAVVSAVAILTYFTNLTTGLVCNLVLVFGYVTYMIINAAYRGGQIPSYTYFWIAWTPAMTTAVYLFSHRTVMLEQDNQRLTSQLTRISGVDTVTELHNMRGFERDANIYFKISQRYQMPLMLLVWEFRFQRELEQLIGSEQMNQLVQQVSDAISAALREEDTIYLLDDSPFCWGTLLFTNPNSTHIVIERVESRIRQIDLQDGSGKHALYLDMRVGSATRDTTITSPLALIEKARKQSEYDVS